MHLDSSFTDSAAATDVTSAAAMRDFFAAMRGLDHGDHPAQVLRRMVAAGLDRLPLPGKGATLQRWQVLAAVAAHDLSLLKLYEGHTDALAILAEIGGQRPPAGSLWGVWCAEAPHARLHLQSGADGVVRLQGRKGWCSGAAGLSHALVSCWDERGQPYLAAVQLDQPGVEVSARGWQAVGMAACASVEVDFSEAPARQVGAAHAYLERPGFWHGGAGIAACWYGAASALAGRLRRQLHTQVAVSTPAGSVAAQDAGAAAAPDPHRLAQLGGIDIALSAAAALLRESAEAIDRHATADAMALALRARLAVEAAANQVLTLATRALGAGPLCQEAHFAQMAADLPVFLRQSHAERDLAALGRLVAAPDACPWSL